MEKGLLEQIILFADQSAHSEGYTDRSDGKFKYSKKEGAVTGDLLAQHLNGNKSLGMYILSGGKSHCLILDFDDHGKDGIAKMPTLAVAMALEDMGVPHIIFRSGGGYGYHIWMFFETAMPQKTLWKFASDLLKAVDEPHTNYVPVASGSLNQKKFNAAGKQTHIEHGVEVLPKGEGDQNVAIPCGRASVPMRVARNGSVASLEECNLSDLKLTFVPVARELVTKSDIGPNDRDAAFDCYIRHFCVDDYAKWGAAGLGLVAAFGHDDEWAYGRWLAWTQSSGKFTPGDEEQWSKLKPKKYSQLSFWRIATKHGYNGPWPGKKGSSDSDMSIFNDQWALMNVEGKVEFLNMQTGHVSNRDSFMLLTKPDEGTRESWLRSPTRRQYNGYTFAPPDYDGDKWNLFRGWPVEPEEGDVSLFIHYVVDMLCNGDKDLAHWVMTFAADAVQRPWSARPGSGLAIRGPQGSGKSFLGKCVKAALGDLTLEVSNSDRVTQQFNDMLVGKTVLLCEEAFFTGSPQQQLMLKNLITADNWTFEPKGRKSFWTPNIFRIIATTNNSQAVAIDNDDRRWTIIESIPHCPFVPTSREARDWWKPYYSMLRDRPGAILHYLLNYEVDTDLIGLPYFTEAKAEDKLTSDPLLQVLVNMVETGACPDDLRGDGRVSSGAMYEAVKALGGRWTSPQTLANELRKRFGAVSSGANCIKVKNVRWSPDANGILTAIIEKRTDVSGLRMPPLSELRAMVSSITGQSHEGPENWVPWEPVSVDEVYVDPNGGDIDGGMAALEAAAETRRRVMDSGKIVKDTPAF